MITLNYNDLVLFIYSLFFPTVRILSFISTAPLLGDSAIGKKIKVVLALIISWFFVLYLPMINIPIFSIDGLLIFIEQIIIGMLLGFSMKLMFSSVFVSGEIISIQMGLSFSSLFDINLYSNISILSKFLYLFLFLFFLEINGHLWMISILFDTFITMPIKKWELNTDFFFQVVNFFKFVFIDGFMLLFPLIIIQVVLHLSLGVLNRLSTQFSIFSIGFTITLLVGIIMLYLFIPMIPSCYMMILNDFKKNLLISFKFY